MKQFEDGDPCFAPMLNALFAAFRGTAVMNGCEVSATGTSRTVSITAGSVLINGEVVAVSAGSVTLDAGSTFDRYDLVSVNASGSKIVTKGTTKRKCPTQPANTCLLAIVFVPAGATVIATGNVYDARMDAMRLSVNQIQAASANLAEITTSRYSLLPDSTLCYADNTEVSQTGTDFRIVKTAPPVPAGRYGTVTVYCNLRSDTTARSAYRGIYKNGERVFFVGTNSRYNVNYAPNINVAPGDVLTLGLTADVSWNIATNTQFEIRAITLPGIMNSLRW